MMRFRREGARRFLRYAEDEYPGSIVMGDCGAFSYAAMAEPPYKPEDTLTFYGDGRFTHGCSPSTTSSSISTRGRAAHARRSQRRPEAVTILRFRTPVNSWPVRDARARFHADGCHPGLVGPEHAARAAADLARMGYETLAVGGTVPLKIEQIRRVLSAIRDAVPISTGVHLHVLGFGKIEHLADLERFGVASFDTTSPLVRAFKDARKNYWARDRAGNLTFLHGVADPAGRRE